MRHVKQSQTPLCIAIITILNKECRSRHSRAERGCIYATYSSRASAHPRGAFYHMVIKKLPYDKKNALAEYYHSIKTPLPRTYFISFPAI